MSDFGSSGDDLNFDIRFNFDGQDAERQTRVVTERIARQFEAIFRNNPDVASRLARQYSNAFDTGTTGAREFTAQMRGAESATDQLIDDLNALTRRAAAFRDTLSAQGANPDLFAVYDREITKVLQLERELQERREDIARDPELAQLYRTQAQTIGRTLRSELEANERFLTNQRELERAAAAQRLAEKNAQYRREQQAARAARGQLVAELQQQTTLENATIRTEGAKAVQAAQARSRARIEIARFTFRQIAFFEQQIARAIRAGASIVGSGLGRIAAGAARLGQVFRRTNRDINEGLNGALIRREQTLDRSLDRQTALVARSVTTQSRLYDQLNAAQSRGVAGVVTGRSGLGAALGGGAAIGGGFLLLRNLREGFEESVNLNESLNKTQQIFREASDDVIAFSEDSVSALFVTQSAALEAAANFGIFGKAAGLSGTELADFSKDLSLLATDLASFNNTSIEDATTAISAALRGESEPIRRYGVLLNEATLQQRAFDLGITESIRKLQPFERVLAANAEIFAQTADQQGDAARTANDFANSSRRAGAAATEFFAAIASAAIPLATRITNFLFPALENLTRFIQGDVSPALQTLRTALIGVGAALGLLLAARVAAEAVQFLGIALRFALTPVGLLIAGVAAIGAAVAIATNRSEGFAEIMRGIVPAIRQLAGRGLQLAAQGFNILGTVLNNTVLPALRAFLNIVGPALITGLEYVIGFILTVAIPVLRNLAQILVARVIPAFRAVASFIVDEVVPAAEALARAIVTVVGAVVNFLQPAIEGFQQLGSAIADAFQTGDFTGLLGGLRAVGVGIGEVFANLGVLIYEALRPQVLRAIRFLSNAFDQIDFTAIGLKILEVVRLIGFVLGSIVSDPLFIQAVEAIAAAAIAVGANFILGFAQGVLSNLPEVVDLIGGQLATGIAFGFRAALDNPAIVVAAIGALFAASAIRNAWRAAGEAGASGVIRGFIPAIQRGLQTNRNFLIGFFGGPGALQREAARVGAQAAASFQRSIDRTNRDINRLGGIGLIPTAQTEAGLRQVRRRLDDVKAGFNEMGVESALTGARAREAFAGAARSVGGFVQILRGDARAGLAEVRAGIQNVATAAADQLAALRARGISLGQLLGQGLTLGFGAAISGQLAGSSGSGTGQAIGLAGILTSALTAGAINPALGVAVGALGAIGFAIGRSGREAEEAAEKIADYVDILEEAGSVATSISGIADRVTEFFQEQDKAVQDLVLRSGLGATDFANFIVEGVDTTEDALVRLGDALNIDVTPLTRLTDAGTSVGELDDIFAIASRQLGGLEDDLQQAGLSVSDFITIVGFLADESSAFNNALGDVDFASKFQVEADIGQRAAEQFEENNRRTVASFDELGQEVTRTQGVFDGVDFEPFDLSGWEEWARDFTDLLRIPAIEAGIFSRGFDELGQPLDENARLLQQSEQALAAYRAELGLTEDAMEDLAPSVDLVSDAINSLNRQRTEGVRRQIDAVRDRLAEAEDQADRAREAITNFFNPSRGANRLVDELIGDLGGIGSTIEESLLQGGVRGEAALRVAVGDFEGSLAEIIQAGFDEGLRTQEQFEALLAPLRAALGEEVGESASRILSTVDFTAGITPAAGSRIEGALNRALAGREIETRVTAAFAAQQQVEAIQAQLDNYEAQLDIDVVFSQEQIEAALIEAGLNPELLVGLNFGAVGQQGLDPLQLAAAQQNAAAETGPAAAAPGPAATGPTITGPVMVNITTGQTLATGSTVVTALGAIGTGKPLPAGTYVPPSSYVPTIGTSGRYG